MQVDRALAMAPSGDDVATTTVHDLQRAVVDGHVGGIAPAHARWAGPELVTLILSGVHEQLPTLLATAGRQWPDLGARLSRTCAELLATIPAS